MLWTGVGELAVVAVVMLGLLPVRRSCQIITLLGSGFLAYRLYADPGSRCPCLGAAPSLVPWLKVNEQIILVTVPFFLVLIGIWGWVRANSVRRSLSEP